MPAMPPGAPSGGISSVTGNAVLSTAASVGGGIFSAFGQKAANKASKKAAAKQRHFQKRMSNTAYTRGMRDMKNAGLNPMLAFSQGGASSPMGSMSVAGNVFDGLAGDLTGGINSATKQKEATAKVSKLSPEVKLINAQTHATTAQAYNQAQQANTGAATQAKIEEETKVIEAGIPFRNDQAFGEVPNTGKARMFFNWLRNNKRYMYDELKGFNQRNKFDWNKKRN